MDVQEIHPNFIPKIWPLVEPFIASALKHSNGEFTTDQMKALLATGQQTLLVATDDAGVHGAVTLTTEIYPNAAVVFVTSIGGRLVADQDNFNQFRNWCQERGFTSIRGCVRDSVLRLWRQRFGAQEIYKIAEIKL